MFVKEFAIVCIADELLCSWHFPEKSAALNASHEKPLCVQDRGFHRKKCLTVTSGSPLPCHVILNFPPLCSSLCHWLVQWKMPEVWNKCHCFSLTMEHRVFEQADWSVMLRLQLTWCCWTNGFSVWCFGAS